MSAEKKSGAAVTTGGMRRTPIIIALILSVLLALSVVIGARVLLGPAGQQQVAMSTLPAPEADSAQCAALVEQLPAEAFGHVRARIAEPVPAGTAAWASSELERVTLRCGVDMPFQYTDLADTVEAEGSTWLPVADVTAGSSLETWYSVDRFPVVAITADSESTGGADNPVSPFAAAVAELEQRDGEPFPAPLTELTAAGDAAVCTDLALAFPEQLTVGGADGVTYQRIGDAELATAGYPGGTVAWRAEGMEPIVIRCGVAPSANYAAGERLQQINDIPWFEDTILASGTTSSTWYALGRETDVAVSLPQSAAQSLITISGYIEDTIPAS